MPTPEAQPPAPQGPLQFEEAEYAPETPGGLTCSECKSPIVDRYYETSGRVVCEPCRVRIQQAYEGGSKVGRAARAPLLGGVAAAVAGAIYYGITKATDSNFGLVAVVVGLLIGGAVKAGSGGRGGLFYQLLALFLTYTTIGASILPLAIEGAREQQQKEEARFMEEIQSQIKKLEAEAKTKTEAGTDKPAAEQTPKSDEVAAPDNTPKGDEPEVAKSEAPADQPGADGETPENRAAEKSVDAPEDDDLDFVMEEEPAPTGVALLIGLGALAAIAYTLPVLVAVNSPISGLIYGFALWEAWKINKKTELAFQGPFDVVPIADEPAAHDGSAQDAEHGA